MKLNRADFDDEELPETAQFTLTLDEAALLYRYCGGIAPLFVTQASGDQKWGEANDGIAECVGNFFNRFYDSGIEDVAPRFGMESIVACKKAHDEGAGTQR